ncbi:MAG: hypothetical protein L6264_06305 [Weeksellaceae bacterium]|nr:hypothetical protein [Bacteroidota bacterium]MCG2780544.1 hypothetical protein [Weeksellaceae bacterium]
MKTKFTLLIFTLIFSGLSKSQVLIATNTAVATVPDQSAVLQVADDKRGLLLPQVALLGATDIVTVPTPVQGLLVNNTSSQKTNFWAAGQWNRNFQIADGAAIIKQTENFSGSSSGSTSVNTFPATMPLFNLNDPTTGWTNLNASSTITITKTSNTNYIVTEGMVQINNDTATNQEFQFAIGVFVNGQLKLASKYTAIGKNFVCNWRKFNLSGVFNDLPIGTHTVSIYGRNLPQVTAGYNSITYGGNTTNCTNINNDMARIFVTAQVTQ